MNFWLRFFFVVYCSFYCWIFANLAIPPIFKILFLKINPFPNKPWFLCVCSASLFKTLWEKEKLLVTSNFSFSQSVFNPFEELSSIFIKFEIVVCKLFQFGRVLKLSIGKGLSMVTPTFFCGFALIYS